MADERTPSLPPLARPRTRWTLLLRGFAAASDPRCLLLAALGLLALRAGWAALRAVFADLPWRESNDGRFDMPDLPSSLNALVGSIRDLFGPFVGFFSTRTTGGEKLVCALGATWVVLVWSLFGGAIARVTAVRIARETRVGLISALRFSLTRMGSLVAAPMAPIGVCVLIGLAGAAVGLLNILPGAIGRGAAAVLAFVPLGVGLLDAVILLGLALAWPLMVATVVVDGEDFFDAISRSYSYVNQRFVPYVGALVASASVGAVGLGAVGLFAQAARGLADWSLGLGAPRGVGFRWLAASPADLGGAARFWHGLVAALVGGWSYSFVWSTAAILYLILRYDVDGADIHDIYREGDAAEGFVPDPEADPATEAGSTAGPAG